MMRTRRFRSFCVRFLAMFRHGQSDRELAEELDLHLQMQTEDYVRSGMTPDEARRQARIKLGGIPAAMEEYRSRRGFAVLETTTKDLKHGLRLLARSPAFTIVAILSLTLGIGANTAVFSLVNTLLFRPLPVAQPQEIVAVINTGEHKMFPTFSYPDYQDFKGRTNVFTGLYAYRFVPVSLSHSGINEKVWGYLATGNYFEVLGVKPAAGRLLQTRDDLLQGAHPVIVLSYRCWVQRFGKDPAIVGNDVILNGRAFEVIGVAPARFYGTEIVIAPDLWFPMAMQEQIEIGNPWLTKREAEYVFVQGRLKAGVQRAQAETAMNSVALQLEREFPNLKEGMRISLADPGISGRPMRGAAIGFATVLAFVVAFVLLLACVNLANLLLARSLERRKEISVRLALGASRGRLLYQLMVESMLLAFTGGLLGFLSAYWLVNAAGSLKLPIDFPLVIDLRLDYRVVLFCLAATVATGFLFGLIPALQATRLDLISAMKAETDLAYRKTPWLRNTLIVAQLALSILLLAGGGLMLQALARAQSVNLGFRPENAVALSFDLRLQGYDEERGREFQKQLMERIRMLPGVQYAGIVDLAPVDLHFPRSAIYIEGQAAETPARTPRAMTNRMSPGALQAIGTRLLRGRDFTNADDESAPRVAIVNETFARRFWPGVDALGKRFRSGTSQSDPLQVVGIVEDGKYANLGESPQPFFSRPLRQSYSGANTLIVRSQGESAGLLATLRAQILQMDPQMAISATGPLSAKMAVPLLPARIAATFLGTFGLLALALAAIGLYGIMSHSVARRTKEIGLRIAMGARSSQVLKLTIEQGMKPALLGMLVGLPATLLLTPFARKMLYGVSESDPLTYGSVCVLLLAVALLACYIPARRATRIDPAAALRVE